MARYMEDRSSDVLFVAGSLESLLPQDAPARRVWAGLLELDMTCLDALYCNDSGGRPAIDARRLVAVWVLALMRGMTSSVALARACGQDIELRWLLGDAPVEKSTLCAFRSRHVETLGALSTQLLAALARADLLPGAEVAIDGTVIRAASSCKACRSRKSLERQVHKLGEIIQTKLSEETPDDSVALLQTRKARLERALQEMSALGMTDPDAHTNLTEPGVSKKHLKKGGFAPAHNVQVSTNMASGAIIHTEVIAQGNDCGQLAPQLNKAQQALEQAGKLLEKSGDARPAAPETVCADAAYHDTRQLLELDKAGIQPLVPGDTANRRPPGVSEAYLAEAFRYDAALDEMRCPEDKALRFRKYNKNKTAKTYQARASDCANCPFKSQCCPGTKRGRSVNRPLHGPFLARIAEQVAAPEGQRCLRARRITAEGAFARISHLLHWPRCRTWGQRGAQAEALWRQITHNLLLLTGLWQPIMSPKPNPA